MKLPKSSSRIQPRPPAFIPKDQVTQVGLIPADGSYEYLLHNKTDNNQMMLITGRMGPSLISLCSLIKSEDRPIRSPPLHFYCAIRSGSNKTLNNSNSNSKHNTGHQRKAINTGVQSSQTVQMGGSHVSSQSQGQSFLLGMLKLFLIAYIWLFATHKDTLYKYRNK